MLFVENAQISRLAGLMRELDVGDRVFCGRLELFARGRPGLEGASAALVASERRAVAEGLRQRPRRLSEGGAAGAASAAPPPSPEPQRRRSRTVSDVVMQLKRSELAAAAPAEAGARAEAAGGDSGGGAAGAGGGAADAGGGGDGDGSGNCSDEVASGGEGDSAPSGAGGGAGGGCGSMPNGEELATAAIPSLLGVPTAREARKLLVHLVSAMNATYPDYDFSDLRLDCFRLEVNFVHVYTTINYQLSLFVERAVPGFLAQLWSAIRDAVDLRQAAVYSYRPEGGERPECPAELGEDAGCLFNFDYFFVDPERLLLFSGATRRKRAPTDGRGGFSGPESTPDSSPVDGGTDADEALYSSGDDEEATRPRWRKSHNGVFRRGGGGAGSSGDESDGVSELMQIGGSPATTP